MLFKNFLNSLLINLKLGAFLRSCFLSPKLEVLPIFILAIIWPGRMPYCKISSILFLFISFLPLFIGFIFLLFLFQYFKVFLNSLVFLITIIIIIIIIIIININSLFRRYLNKILILYILS